VFRNGDLETHYTEFLETSGDLLSRLFENYGASLSPEEKQSVITGLEEIFTRIKEGDPTPPPYRYQEFIS